MDCAVTALPRLEWFPDWSGETVICVAGGPSASFVEILAALRGSQGRARCIAINESYRLAPWADVLYAADYFWWLKNKGVPGFGGLKVSVSVEAADRYFPGVKYIELSRIVGAGRNSGAQTLILATLFGPRRVVLVGYDMTLSHGIHWHGAHGGGSHNPTKSSLAKWAQELDRAAPSFAAAGVEVLNASPISALTAYPRISLETAFELA